MSPASKPSAQNFGGRHYADNCAELGLHVACCNVRWMVSPLEDGAPMIETPDRLIEAGKILRGETRMLAND
jgi:hypothetical protein